MRIAALVAVTLMTPASAAPVPKVIPKTNAEKLVGTWKLTKSSRGPDVNVTLFVDFEKDGTLTIRQSDEGDEEEVYKGKYRVEGGKIPYSVHRGDTEHAETLTIKKLTDDELIVVDPDNIQEDFKRHKK